MKPDPSDVLLHSQLVDPYDYEQMQQLENSYYGTTGQDMKYAKTTVLTDRGLAGMGGMGGMSGLAGGYNNGYITSTPLHASNSNIGLGLDYLGNLGSGHNIYDMHNQYQQQLHRMYQQQQHQQQMAAGAYPMRRFGSRAEIDILERETSSQIRVSDLFRIFKKFP